MAASQRETILKALKTCLQGITTANSYAIEVKEVRRGIHFEDDMPNRPALGFSNIQSRRTELSMGGPASGYSERVLTVLIYGYVDCQPDDYDNLDDLMQAVEQRLNTAAAWAYRQFTDIKNFTVYEGGAHDRIGYFDMEIEISYQHAVASP